MSERDSWADMFRRLFSAVREIKRMIAAEAFGAGRGFEIKGGGPYDWPAMSMGALRQKKNTEW